jgi:hypothetical protein
MLSAAEKHCMQEFLIIMMNKLKGCRNPQRLGTPCLINQAKYSMFVREPEAGLLDVLEEKE